MQVTTRLKRDEEESGVDYNFITDNQYKNIKDNLIFRTHFNDHNYGTTNVLISEKIALIIASEEGINDGIAALEDGRLEKGKTRLIIIGLNKKDIPLDRENRSPDFILNEFNVLKKCTEVINIAPGQYANPVDVASTIVSYFL